MAQEKLIQLSIFFKKNFNDIKKYGFAEFLRKLSVLFKIILKIPFYFFSILIFIFIMVLNRIVTIRIGNIISQRLGHFISEPELYLCELDQEQKNNPNKKYFDIFFYDGSISNSKVDNMIKEHLFVAPSLVLEPLYNILKFLAENLRKENIFNPFSHLIKRPISADRDVKNFFQNNNQRIKLSQSDLDKGFKILKEMGVKNKNYVCLAVRDENYLNKMEPRGDWSYHDYRNSNIINYLEAADELTKRGYYVLRMGKNNKIKFETNNPMIIDYSFSKYRSDFMDIFLGGNCSFCISTGFGFDAIPYVFRRPIGYVYAPLGYLFSFTQNSTAIFKKYYSLSDNRFLKINEIFTSELAFVVDGNILQQKKIKLVENTPEEIKDLAVEMDEKFRNKWSISDGKLLQNKFWDTYLHYVKKYNKENLHGKINM